MIQRGASCPVSKTRSSLPTLAFGRSGKGSLLRGSLRQRCCVIALSTNWARGHWLRSWASRSLAS